MQITPSFRKSFHMLGLSAQKQHTERYKQQQNTLIFIDLIDIRAFSILKKCVCLNVPKYL